MTSYGFTKSPINSVQLLDEIATAGLPAPVSLEIEDSALTLGFTNDLDAGQQSSLGSVVAAHVANSAYLPLAQQAAIAQLIAYLNSGTTTVANAARAQMVLALAPRLPLDILTTVNANIRAVVGF